MTECFLVQVKFHGSINKKRIQLERDVESVLTSFVTVNSYIALVTASYITN